MYVVTQEKHTLARLHVKTQERILSKSALSIQRLLYVRDYCARQFLEQI